MDFNVANGELSGCPHEAFYPNFRKHHERHSIGQSARMTC